MDKRFGLAITVAYVLLDWASYIHPVGGLAITPWNPHIGLMVAVLLMQGSRSIPWFLLAAVLSELVVRRSMPGSAAWFISVFWPTCLYGYAAHLFRRWQGGDFHLQDYRDLIHWLFFSLPCTLIVGLLFVTFLSALGALPWPQWAEAVQRYWVGDWLGVVIVAPLILVWRAWPNFSLQQYRSHFAGIWVCVAIALYMIVGDRVTGAQIQYFYLLFIPLIWATIAFSLHGATAVLALIQIALIVLIMVRELDVSVLVSFQLLLFVMAITGLFLGISVHERIYTQVALRKRESDLNRALNRAAAGELASTLAHELNQPLTAISAYSLAGQQLVAREQLNAEAIAEIMQKLRNESQRAGQVVHRLRRFFRSGELHCEPLDLITLIHSAWEPLLRRAEKQQIEFVVSDMDKLPAISADRVQIEIVLYNLFRNALDAIDALASQTATRLISVSARVEDQHLRVIVTDTGCGIAETQHAHLFEAFNTSKVDGLGLGLNICRTLIESHRGQLWLASSRPGHTRFCFTLPIVS